MPPRHPVRQLITRCKNQMIAMDAASVARRRRNAVSFRRHVDDLEWRKNPRTALSRGFQQCKRGLPRIDHQISKAQERRGPRDSKLVMERSAVQEAARQTACAPRFVLAIELLSVEDVAREIERIAPRDVGHVQFTEPRRERFHRQARSAPGADGPLLADLARERRQRRVDFILHERGTRDRRALGEAALVDDHDLSSRGCQRISNQGSGNAGADHEHVGRDVAVEAVTRHGRRASALPDRASAAQISFCGSHRSALAADALLQCHWSGTP